ncbi:hypothetical protein LZ554_002519 [Drepanopeziza brunnea f. sp. 'monogermtubi']|nr:hypothetical protein LZ554_002519 [Drepanopeziza brunnea f. sp. 'monogermtubi']
MSDKDVEKETEGGLTRYESRSAAALSHRGASGQEASYKHYEERTAFQQPYYKRVLESFKRDPALNITPNGVIGANGHVFHSELAAQNTANSPLARKLKGRHLQMIAIGGSIGTGLFVASGKALEAGGPASLLISFSLIGIMLYCTMHALGEMAVLFPVAGSFSAYSTRFLDPAWGFAMGWNYCMQWLTVLPLEIIAASMTIKFWEESPNFKHATYVAIFLVLVVGINMFGVKGILGIILNCGGGPDTGYIGARYWRNPGSFHDGFRGLCSVFVTAAFAFGGTELVGLAAAETANPRKSLPTAIKQVFWRISIFYIASLTIIGLLVPYNDPRLVGGGPSVAAASPFVISINNAGIEILPSVMNIVILIAVLSVGNSAIFGSSRTLASLAEQGQAPQIFSYIDRKGRPLVAICFASFLGLLAFVADSGQQDVVLDWLLATSGLSSILTWGSICLSHIRFRHAWKVQGHTLDELAFRSQSGLVGSWIGFIFNCLVLITQFWTGAWPVGYVNLTMSEQLQHFFRAYLAAPIVVLFYLGYKYWFKTSFMRAKDMDLKTGRRDLNLPELIAEEKAERQSWPQWKRAYKSLC